MRRLTIPLCVMMVAKPCLASAQNTPADYMNGSTTWTYVGTYISQPGNGSPTREMLWLAQRQRKVLPDNTPRLIARTRKIVQTLRDGATIAGNAPIHGTTFVNINAYTCEVDHTRRRTASLSSVAYDENGREIDVFLEDINPDDPAKWWVNTASDSASGDKGRAASREGDQICSLGGFQ
jgi:hypothetical protein